MSIISMDFEQCKVTIPTGELPYVLAAHEWLKNFVMQPHPDLGRQGNVCPFVQQSHEAGRLLYSLIDLTSVTEEAKEFTLFTETRIKFDEYLQRHDPYNPRSNLDATAVIIIGNHNIEELAIVERVQKQLKNEVIQYGCMIGEFHQLLHTPGIRATNPEAAFYPLASPVPMLVIRKMHPTDLLFMRESPHHFEAYLRLFSDKVRPGTKRYTMAKQTSTQSPEYSAIFHKYLLNNSGYHI